MSDNDADDADGVKIVVVGDGAIGKTCLLISYRSNEFPTQHVPTIFENVTIDKTINMNGQELPISLDLWDTAGQEQFDRLRILAYKNTDVFLVCFSVVDNVSFQNLESKWIPEIKYHAPDAMVLLVGLKCDLKNDDNALKKLKQEGKLPIEDKVIDDYKNKMGAIGYVETSALKRINVDLAFETAIKKFLEGGGGDDGAKGDTCCVLL